MQVRLLPKLRKPMRIQTFDARTKRSINEACRVHPCPPEWHSSVRWAAALLSTEVGIAGSDLPTVARLNSSVSIIVRTPPSAISSGATKFNYARGTSDSFFHSFATVASQVQVTKAICAPLRRSTSTTRRLESRFTEHCSRFSRCRLPRKNPFSTVLKKSGN